MVEALPLRVFVASAGDLKDERAAVRACIDEHRRRRKGQTAVTYEVVAWNQVRGTVRRPQEAINELISECHFMIVLFKRSWGSEPGSPWGYTSGTEEELFTGLLELGQHDQPMRDVWVAFVEDPAPSERIDALRQQMIDRHLMMFESISDVRDLKEKLSDRLESWEALAVGKVPRHVDLLPSSGRDLLKAANLRIRGEKLIELGQHESGRGALNEAAALGGPVEQLSYARFLRRHGELDGAYSLTQEAIDFFVDGNPLYSTLAADAFSAQARVLSAQDRDVDAIGRLEHALSLIVGDDAYATSLRCRILDDLGLARQRTSDLAGAQRSFETALQLRQDSGTEYDVCQSLVNLSRLAVIAGELEIAAGDVDHVLESLRGTPPTGLHANAEILMAQVLRRQGKPADAIPFAERGVALDRQFANRKGEAIALLVLSQCCNEDGRTADALRHVRACLDLNRSMENQSGVRIAEALLDKLSV
jgi:tetratricopeptide (TPR) repeat protein